ncbi:MAG TPA: sigma-70 family RNA polymerase sigma factor [Capsulimonadaceae bacterium]
MSRSVYQRAQKGDSTAISYIVTLLRPRIAKMAAYYAQRSAEAPEDLEQEAWLALLEALGKIDVTIGTPEQFLLKHARWQMLDAIKRGRVRQCVSLDEQMAETHLPPVPAHQPEVDVQQFLGILPPTQRAVAGELIRGRTWREAGETLGCTSANIAYHVRLIRRRYEDWSGHQAEAG